VSEYTRDELLAFLDAADLLEDGADEIRRYGKAVGQYRNHFTGAQRPAHVCQALVGTIGRRVRCAIYDRRPRACVLLEPGSKACHRVRAETFETLAGDAQ
jgi:Fe-S-cluster containining protein